MAGVKDSWESRKGGVAMKRPNETPFKADGTLGAESQLPAHFDLGHEELQRLA